MFPEWRHKFMATKPYAGDGYGAKAVITVEAGLHYIAGNSRPYFSVTGDIRIPGRRDIESGGMLHREILAHWPALAPVTALHLSDDNGQPMHGNANGWYQLAGYYGGAGERYHAGNSERQHWNADGSFNGYRYSTPEECLQSFADYIRIPFEVAKGLADSWQRGVDYADAKPLYFAWYDTQAERFKMEADAAITLLDESLRAVTTT